MKYFILEEDKDTLRSQVFEVLMDKFYNIDQPSLRNFILNNTLSFATTDAQIEQLVQWLKAGSIPLKPRSHPFTKSQRYTILKQVFRMEKISRQEKDALLAKEMKIDYSDVDENQKIACMACLPEADSKAELWQKYLTQDAMSQENFSYSSAFFINSSDKEMCNKYADLFLSNMEEVKKTRHRDFAQIFFNNLSPAFLGKQEHLDSFKAMFDRTKAKNEDPHFIKLLSN
jgi:hypothetical protein